MRSQSPNSLTATATASLDRLNAASRQAAGYKGFGRNQINKGEIWVHGEWECLMMIPLETYFMKLWKQTLSALSKKHKTIKMRSIWNTMNATKLLLLLIMDYILNGTKYNHNTEGYDEWLSKQGKEGIENLKSDISEGLRRVLSGESELNELWLEIRRLPCMEGEYRKYIVKLKRLIIAAPDTYCYARFVCVCRCVLTQSRSNMCR